MVSLADLMEKVLPSEIVTTQVTWSQSSIIIYDKRIYTEEKRRDTIGE
jgi:hypothetical protein